MKAYRKPSGVYIETDDNTPVSTTLVQVAARPSTFHVFAPNWNTDPLNEAVCWVLDAAASKQDLKDKVSAKRYDVETAGINFTYRTVATPVNTARETRASMIGAYTKAKELRWVEAPATEKPFKFGDGVFRPATTQEVIDIYLAVEAHVDACYAVETQKLSEIDATGTTDVNTGWPATANTTTSIYFQK